MLRPDSRRFRLVLIKTSRYDDDGYVISWRRSAIPSNSLAVLSGIARDCAARRVLGDDVEILLTSIDETNTPVRAGEIASLVESAGSGIVMLVGVQSNQFPRAMDIARPLRARGIPVIVGGFHVSGTIAMLGLEDPGLQRALEMGVSLFAGEAEGRLDGVLRDAHAGSLKPIYNYLNDLPDIAGGPMPLLSADEVGRNVGRVTSFDAGRGCPFQCSFCTIINVQGRASRSRTPDDVERIVRANLAQGLTRFFITDDNFARNTNWEPIVDRLIALRTEEGLRFSLIIQVDAQCHRIPRFIEKCAQAGVKRVYIGLESISPENLMAAKKRQNRLADYRALLLAWKKVRVIAYAGYIMGFPNDTEASILRDVEIIKRELAVELLEFFFLTPLPGSEDHQRLVRAGVTLDPDLNHYNLSVRDHGTPADVEGGVGARVPDGVADLLHRRTHRDHPPADRRRPGAPRQGARADHLVQGLHGHRAAVTARGRVHPAQVPPGTSARDAGRARVAVLPEVLVGQHGETGEVARALPAPAPHLPAHQIELDPLHLHRRRAVGDRAGLQRGWRPVYECGSSTRTALTACRPASTIRWRHDATRMLRPFADPSISRSTSSRVRWMMRAPEAVAAPSGEENL